MCHFYAEILKSGLIVKHFKLFGGKLEEGKKIFGGDKRPHAPSGAATAQQKMTLNVLFFFLFF